MKNRGASAAWIAWLVAAIYYFYQYALRSAPSVMLPQLSDAFQLSSLSVASLVGFFYYGYSPFSLVAGTAIDRLGARAVVPTGAIVTGLGAILFGTGNLAAANAGRFLQGAGGVFALIGAVYIIGESFPASRAATLVGATQMFGMAGGSAGQFVVGPLIAAGIAWNSFWIGMGILGLLIGACLILLLPKPSVEKKRQGDGVKSVASSLGVVFRNPQSILCGLISGLLFIPTSIFDMIWGVRYLQEAHGFDFGDAVMRSASVPLGWIIGAPLLGMVSDRIGRRKPVIAGGACVLLGCLAWILFGSPRTLPPYVLGLVAGVASGSAMLPYTVIKEANPSQYAGTATGVINFLNFTFSALLGPVFGGILQSVSGGQQRGLSHYQMTFQPLLWGVGLAIVLTLILKETGQTARAPEAAAKEAA
jgi:MFS family permease